MSINFFKKNFYNLVCRLYGVLNVNSCYGNSFGNIIVCTKIMSKKYKIY